MANTDIKQKLLHIRSALYKSGYLFAAFFLCAGLIFSCYLLFGVPSDKSVLALDLNAQYVYYYDYMHDVFGNGESLFYCWSRNLSGEFFGIIGYYLASPFNIIVWLFPREMITDGLMWMIIAKIGTCGCLLSLYLHRARGLQKTTAVIFSPLYALCAFAIVQTMNPMWLDGVLILPIVMWGVEALVKHNRFRMLVLSLVYAFVTNFYIGFMIAIFTVLYYIAAYFANADYSAGAKSVCVKFVGKGALAALSGITSAMISAFMLIPVYYSLQNGKLEFTDPDYSLTNNFEIADVFRKLFLNSYDTVRMDGLPFLFCGSITLILAALFFFCKKIPLSQRLAGGGLTAALLLCMYIKPADMMWHGGQVPNWLPYRYSFIISLLLVVMAAHMFERLKDVSGRSVGVSTLAIIMLLIFAEGRDNFIESLGDGGREVFDPASVVFPALIFIIIAAAAIMCVRRTYKNGRLLSMSAVIMIVALTAGEMSFNASNSFTKMDEDITYSTKPSYIDIIVPLREKVAEIKESDPGFYRIEKNFFRTVNDPIATGMYGLSHSSSTLNARAIDMLGYYGFTSNGHYTRFSGNTPPTCDIFGVKYILDAEGGKDNIKGDKSKITVTENPDALPIAYLTDTAVKKNEPEKGKPFINQETLLTAMTGDDASGIYTEISAGEPIAKNCTQGGYADEHLGFTNPGNDASVTYNITSPKDGDVYMFIPTDYQREVYVYVNGSYKDVLFESDNQNIKKLGTFTKGEEIEVRLDLKRNDLYFQQPQFVVYDPAAEQEAINKLNALNKDTVVERLSGTDVKITVNADTERTLFTTIPAEKGWEVFVDGEKANYYTVLANSLIALDVSAGSHTVELKFTPAGYPGALILTFAGIVLFILMILLPRRLNLPVKTDLSLLNGDGEEEPFGTDSEEDRAQRFADIEQLLSKREKKEKKDDTDG